LPDNDNNIYKRKENPQPIYHGRYLNKVTAVFHFPITPKRSKLMYRNISKLFLCAFAFAIGLFVGWFTLQSPFTANDSPTRPFVGSQPDQVSQQSPDVVTDAFLIACVLHEYESAAWLADPAWLDSQGGIEAVCTAVAAPPLVVERLVNTQRQTDQMAFVEWVWFEEESSVVAYFFLEKNVVDGWQIVGLTSTR
jgi:hypothetical protein